MGILDAILGQRQTGAGFAPVLVEMTGWENTRGWRPERHAGLGRPQTAAQKLTARLHGDNQAEMSSAQFIVMSRHQLQSAAEQSGPAPSKGESQTDSTLSR